MAAGPDVFMTHWGQAVNALYDARPGHLDTAMLAFMAARDACPENFPGWHMCQAMMFICQNDPRRSLAWFGLAIAKLDTLIAKAPTLESGHAFREMKSVCTFLSNNISEGIKALETAAMAKEDFCCPGNGAEVA